MEQASARQYTADELPRLASTSVTDKCECPNHLTELVFALRAFQDYRPE